MRQSVLSLPSSRQGMTKHFSNLSRGVGSALYRQYARRQCLLCLREMLVLDDAALAEFGTSRGVLMSLRDRFEAGDIPAGLSEPKAIAC
jgi:hypothetical protein